MEKLNVLGESVLGPSWRAGFEQRMGNGRLRTSCPDDGVSTTTNTGVLMTTIEHPALHLPKKSEVTSSRVPRSGYAEQLDVTEIPGPTKPLESNYTGSLMRMCPRPNL